MLAIKLIIAVVLGLIAGGVINALSDDLPLRRTPRLPRYVPDSKKRAAHSRDEAERATTQLDDEPRPFIAWLGLTAFLFGKRTSPDGVRLNWRYPLTELLTVALMVITVLATQDNPEVTNLQLAFWLGYMALFVLITVIDVEHKLILFVVIIPSWGFALLEAILTPEMAPPSVRDALIGGVAGFVVFFILYNGGFLFTYVMGILRGQKINEVAFGYGDVMMATFSGLILGWQALIFAMFITVFLGAFGALLFLLSRALSGSRYSAFTALPYGPYIVAGTWLMLLFSDEVGRLLGG
ncbi:MAG: A24 family peptidase [bacterium]|nr:A24 family peptidase [bacterium]